MDAEELYCMVMRREKKRRGRRDRETSGGYIFSSHIGVPSNFAFLASVHLGDSRLETAAAGALATDNVQMQVAQLDEVSRRRSNQLPPHSRRERTESPIKQRSDLLELRLWEKAPLSGSSF